MIPKGIGASSGNRTHAKCLEGTYTSRYTIPAEILKNLLFKIVVEQFRIISTLIPNSAEFYLLRDLAKGFE